MSLQNMNEIYQVLSKPGPPSEKTQLLSSLSKDDIMLLAQRAFLCRTSDSSAFSADQKFLAISFDYNSSFIIADIWTGFDNTIEECIDVTTLYKSKIRNFIVLLFKLPEQLNAHTDLEAKRIVAQISSTGISAEDLFKRAYEYELVHVTDYDKRK
ncbi:hypothetical protein OM416_20610 [Paenibacillus sp. LS1]|uniref:hypothetical protein n=1 Tax=Paenibacillus sp. LS1 TaxID=2992120 RepID=UPI0022309015|nr:hypothetical protein [Paenibacillus sp. LS1]MCW3794001.1 hypothetical protein [Paenibacillus sp. LS1]